MDMLDGESHVRDYALERQMMLSDGVFAIAMTLMALELRAPPGWDHTVAGFLNGAWPQVFAYVMSFAMISIFWAMHRQSFGRFRRSDFLLTFFGLLSLGFVAAIPFATRLYSEDAMAGRGLGGAARLYVGAFAGASLSAALTWAWACARKDIIAPEVGPRVKVAVFLLTLLNAPLLSLIGVVAGASGRPWLFGLMAAVGAAVAVLRRWATRADAAHAAPRKAHAHG